MAEERKKLDPAVQAAADRMSAALVGLTMDMAQSLEVSMAIGGLVDLASRAIVPQPSRERAEKLRDQIERDWQDNHCLNTDAVNILCAMASQAATVVKQVEPDIRNQVAAIWWTQPRIGTGNRCPDLGEVFICELGTFEFREDGWARVDAAAAMCGSEGVESTSKGGDTRTHGSAIGTATIIPQAQTNPPETPRCPKCGTIELYEDDTRYICSRDDCDGELVKETGDNSMTATGGGCGTGGFIDPRTIQYFPYQQPPGSHICASSLNHPCPVCGKGTIEVQAKAPGKPSETPDSSDDEVLVLKDGHTTSTYSAFIIGLDDDGKPVLFKETPDSSIPAPSPATEELMDAFVDELLDNYQRPRSQQKDNASRRAFLAHVSALEDKAKLCDELAQLVMDGCTWSDGDRKIQTILKKIAEGKR